MRNTYLKDVRKAWDDSKVLFGKTKVMAKALGTTQENEYQENLHKLSKVLPHPPTPLQPGIDVNG